MKLTICFLLFSALYAGATTKSTSSEEVSRETTSPGGISTQGLELVLDKLEQMNRKLLELQSELMEQRKEMERNQASNEKMFADFANDVARNISVLHDQSRMILAQQMEYSSHEQFRETRLNLTMKGNEGQGMVQPLEASHSDADLADTTPIIVPTPQTVTTEKPSPATSTTSATPPRTPTIDQKPSSYSSCKNVPSEMSGIYPIRVNNASELINVYCEQEKFEGGWIVIQHRFDGSVEFDRNWDEYKNGFGELDSEFWLGLERIHQLTTARKHELIVEMKDFEETYKYARYSSFQISSESDQYELTLGSYSGTAGDGWATFHNGVKFSTNDRDNDGDTDYYWADLYEGGWWFGTEGSWSNLNGRYQNTNSHTSIWWYTFTTPKKTHGLSFTRIMIREL